MHAEEIWKCLWKPRKRCRVRKQPGQPSANTTDWSAQRSCNDQNTKYSKCKQQSLVEEGNLVSIFTMIQMSRFSATKKSNDLFLKMGNLTHSKRKIHQQSVPDLLADQLNKDFKTTVWRIVERTKQRFGESQANYVWIKWKYKETENLTRNQIEMLELKSTITGN